MTFSPEILYIDNHVLVANKPAGLATQGSSSGEMGFEELCRHWQAQRLGKDNAFLYTVHRLDTPVSGIVVMALSSKALSRMQEGQRQGYRKEYVAAVHGVPYKRRGRLRHFLFHDEKQHKALVATQEHPSAKEALLSYRMVTKEKDVALLEILLETGRYHQIRAQLAAAGHPIIGDAKYGSEDPFLRGKIALHHHRLAFTHPTTKELLQLTAPLPLYWASCLPAVICEAVKDKPRRR